ncbi:MAG TPA: acyl-CoA thioesterase domain-containing protein [Aldersonia sp.]
MADLWNDVLACLDMQPLPPDEPGHRFEGRNLQLDYHRLFGGQLLAQLVHAAQLACPDKQPKSMHTVFAREGKSGEPVRFQAAVEHDGRSFAVLTLCAQQSHGVVATATVSMHVGEEGPERQRIAAVAPVLPPAQRVRYDLLPWETRAATDLNTTLAEPAEFEFWMRTPEVDPQLAPALTAYATDLNLIGTALLPLPGFSQRGNGTDFVSAVTSHTLWFHRPFRTDGWLLLRQHSPLLAHGRCFGRGDVLAEDGTLVASFAQEALVRFAPAALEQLSGDGVAAAVER